VDYSKNKQYFKATGSMAPGIALLVVGFLLLFAQAFLGIIVMAIGAFLLYRNTLGAKDDEIDRICQNNIQSMNDKALIKLGVDEDEVKLIEPIKVSGYYYYAIGSQPLFKKGKDGRWRSSNYESTIMLFSENQIHAYTYRFSLVENEKSELTDEYFYKDVVSVSTSTDNVSFTNPETKKPDNITFQNFKLTTSGGTSISNAMWDSGTVENSIQGMRQLLKQKKMA